MAESKRKCSKVLAAVATATMVLSGCAVAPYQVTLQHQFDARQAQRLMQPGVNIVEGSALIRQQGGGVVTCAGQGVSLIPRTDYAAERTLYLWGNVTRGYSHVYAMNMQFTPDPPAYGQHVARTICDAQGNFQFSNVADGEFFVVTVISWVVAGRVQGGGLFQAVSVNGGEVKRVVLSP